MDHQCTQQELQVVEALKALNTLPYVYPPAKVQPSQQLLRPLLARLHLPSLAAALLDKQLEDGPARLHQDQPILKLQVPIVGFLALSLWSLLTLQLRPLLPLPRSLSLAVATVATT